jgi:hypothetical protein
LFTAIIDHLPLLAERMELGLVDNGFLTLEGLEVLDAAVFGMERQSCQFFWSCISRRIERYRKRRERRGRAYKLETPISLAYPCFFNYIMSIQREPFPQNKIRSDNQPPTLSQGSIKWI